MKNGIFDINDNGNILLSVILSYDKDKRLEIVKKF